MPLNKSDSDFSELSNIFAIVFYFLISGGNRHPENTVLLFYILKKVCVYIYIYICVCVFFVCVYTIEACFSNGIQNKYIKLLYHNYDF